MRGEVQLAEGEVGCCFGGDDDGAGAGVTSLALWRRRRGEVARVDVDCESGLKGVEVVLGEDLQEVVCL